MSSRDQQLNRASEVTPATAKGLRLSPVPVERFDEYVVVARLGRGGMAEVILGLSQGPQGFRKLTAIKRLHAHGEQDPELVRMFQHEAAVSALLEHPNVIQTYKVGTDDGRHFMAMEYLEGQPFSRALPRLCGVGKGLDLVLAARIAADALAGLAYIHDATSYDGTPLGLVHRDVSPQNLFITYDGQVKVLDFGIAKVTAVMTAEQTMPGLVKGKLGYIGPEQANGQVDRRADIWSIGVVLWETLIGRRLFQGESEVEQLRAMLSEEIPAVRSLRSDVPPALAQIVTRALQRERAQRYASATEMKAALDAWLSTQADHGAPPGSPHEPVGRRLLASLMQTRFSDAISERRAAVLECLAAVEHEQRGLHVAESEPVSSASLRTSMPTVVPGGETRPSAGHERVKRAAVLALFLMAGAALLTLGVTRNASPALPAASAPAGQLAAQPVRAQLRALQAEPANAPLSPPLSAALHASPSGAPRTKRAASPAVEKPATGVASASPRTPAREQETAQDGEHVAPTSGRLRLDASPYAVVSLEGRRLGITPIDVELPAATHILVLRNPERGIETTYSVQVVAGESLLRRVELE